jgi:hypothetical protein
MIMKIIGFYQKFGFSLDKIYEIAHKGTGISKAEWNDLLGILPKK